MQRIIMVSTLLILSLISLVPGGVALAWQGPANLVNNPGFEGDYFSWSGIPEVYVAHGWTPWWRPRRDADPPAYYHRPEYKQANGYIYPDRVRSGLATQQWFTFFSTHEAGLYQQVSDVMPGSRYRFTVWAQVWSSSEDNPDFSINPAYPNLQVGIDPTGSWNPYGGSVVWSGTYAFYDTWGQLAVEAIARNHVITVFMRSEPNFPVKHNDMYWDDAELVAVGQSSAPIQATATSTPSSADPPAPTATCAPVPPDWIVYTVQSGDTLWGLATRTGATMAMIESVNCLSTRTIEVGQELFLPMLPATVTPTAIPSTSTPKPTTPSPQATDTPQPSASPTPTQEPATPTKTASPMPTQEPATPTKTVVPPTKTAVPPTETPEPSASPTAAATPTRTVPPTATFTKAPPTIPPPATSTPGKPAALPTSTPSDAAARPCGTIAVSGGIVLVAGIFGLRQRRRSDQV